MIVEQRNAAKFSQNTSMQAILLSTGNKVHVESNLIDNIWGIGLHANDPDVKEPEQWKSLKLLGLIMMNARYFKKTFLKLINKKNS